MLLAAALALSLAAAKFAFDSPDALRVLTPFLRGAGIFFCAAYCLLLFWRLALYAALVAFLAPLWTIGFFSLLHAPFPSAAPITLLLMGAITATVCLQHFAVGAGALSRWADPETAANLAQRPGLYCGALAHLPAAVGAVALSGLSVNNIAANGEFAFIAWSAFLLVAALVIPAVMFTYTPSENFAAHVNHARERGEIFLFHVALVAMPRWAYATIGIAFVLATIFFFRGDPNGTYLAAFCSQLARNSNVLAAIIFASGLGGWLAARDWRALPACIGLPLLTAGIATWTATRVPPMPGAQSDLPFLIQTIVAGAIVVLATGSWSYYRRCGENVVGATAHTLEEFGILAIFCVAVVTAIAPLIRVGMEALAFAAETWLNVAVAVMLANEITVVMDDIFPRHRPVEDIFGRRDTRNKSSL